MLSNYKIYHNYINYANFIQRTKIAIFVVVFLVCGTPTTVFTTYPFSVLESDKLINEVLFFLNN